MLVSLASFRLNPLNRCPVSSPSPTPVLARSEWYMHTHAEYLHSRLFTTINGSSTSNPKPRPNSVPSPPPPPTVARSKRMKEAKKEAEALCNAFRAEKEAAYQASMQKVRRS